MQYSRSKCSRRRGLFGLLPALIMVLVTASPAQAGVIGTEQAIQLHQRAAHIEQLQNFLGRDDARAALMRMGVDPASAAARVEHLTAAEAAELAGRIDELPAGSLGIFEVAGVVVLVLLLLEVLGVTNVFTSI
ncbi:MAG: PA2779 family protein [Pseudomonadales bacterium]